MDNLINRKFSKLTVIKFSGFRMAPAGYKQPKWECKCDCGVIIITLAERLKSGGVKTCGCSRKTHGHASHKNPTSEYTAWQQMKLRVLNKKHKAYARYGGRGITICERWINSFENFLTDMGKKKLPKLSLWKDVIITVIMNLIIVIGLRARSK